MKMYFLEHAVDRGTWEGLNWAPKSWLWAEEDMTVNTGAPQQPKPAASFYSEESRQRSKGSGESQQVTGRAELSLSFSPVWPS